PRQEVRRIHREAVRRIRRLREDRNRLPAARPFATRGSSCAPFPPARKTSLARNARRVECRISGATSGLARAVLRSHRVSSAPIATLDSHHAPRALGVAAAWALGALPAITGLARCPSALWLHHACPGCGMTRAVHLLAHGDLAASLVMHPLAVPCALATAVVALATIRSTLLHGSPVSLLGDRFGRGAVVALVAVNVALVVLWCARALGA